MAKWKSTTFKGIRYREHLTRKHGKQPDRYFNVRFQVKGVCVNEGYGWASEGMSGSKAFDLMRELKEELKIGKGSGLLSDRQKAAEAAQEAKRKAEYTENNKPTMADLWEAYQDKLALQKRKKAATTAKEERRKWKIIIEPVMGTVKVEDITPAMLSSLLKKIAGKAPVNANRLHSLLSVMFKPALEMGWITVHPLQWVDKPGGSEPARRRYLSDSEIKTVWPHFDQLPQNPRDIFKMILLTAQRPGEIMAMKWADIDMNRAIWTMPETKNGSINIVPLSKLVMDMLLSRHRGDGYTKKTMWMIGSEYVFPSKYNGNQTHAKYTKKSRERVYQLSGVTGWTSHDLRRTARTIMSRLRIKQHVRERVLNHSQGGIVGVYDQFDYLQEKADALNKLSNEILKIIGKVEKINNIVAIKQAV